MHKPLDNLPGIRFKPLSKEDAYEFRLYARENDPPNMEDWFLYHPVCRDEWLKRGITPPHAVLNVITLKDVFNQLQEWEK